MQARYVFYAKRTESNTFLMSKKAAKEKERVQAAFTAAAMNAAHKAQQKEYTYFERLRTDAFLFQEQQGFTYYLQVLEPQVAVALFTAERRAAKRKAKEIYKLLTNTQAATTSAIDTADRAERKINNDVVLYKRENTSNWSARIKRYTGKWVRYSTGTSNLEKAKAIAEERYREMKYAQKTGKVDITKRFKDVCLIAKQQLEEEYAETERTQVKDKIRVIEKYLIPILGKYDTHLINAKVLQQFDEERTKIAKKQLSKSTINTHNSALNYCFDLAQRHNFIVEKPKLTNKGKQQKGKARRDYFTDADYRKLTTFMRNDLTRKKKLLEKEEITVRQYELRELLRDIVLILANTGIRAGTELLTLRWRDVEIATDKKIGKHLVFTVAEGNAKTRTTRSVVSFESAREKETDKRYNSWSALERIKNRFKKFEKLTLEECTQHNDLIFRLACNKKVPRSDALAHEFRDLLNEAKLLTDKKGNKRTLYSLRHTYASRRLKEGMSYERLSTNLGNSPKILYDYYNHFESKHAPALYTGHAYRDKN